MPNRLNIPAFTPATPIIDGISNKIEAADVNNLFSNTNGVHDALDKLTNLTSDTVSSNFTIANNEGVSYFVNCAGGNITSQLPLGANQDCSIVFKKIDSTYNYIAVTCSGSDVIEIQNENETTPTNTVMFIRCPNESIEIEPTPGNKARWRIKSRYFNPRISGRYRRSSTQSVSGNIQVFYDTKISDTANFFSAVSGEYWLLPKLPGYYHIEAQCIINAGTATDLNMAIYKNASSFAEGGRTRSADVQYVGVRGIVYLNGNTDYVSAYVNTSGVPREIIGGDTATTFEFHYLHE